MAKAKKSTTTRRSPRKRLAWWQVVLIGGKRATRLGMVQAPEGDAKGAMAKAVATYEYLPAAEKKRLAVTPA